MGDRIPARGGGFFGGLDAWVSSGGQLCDVRRRIDGVWVAGAAWVTSDGSSRRRHVTAGGDARRRPVASERERERERDRESKPP